MEFPFIIGFYDTQFKSPIVTFLYKDATEVDPLSKSKLMAKW